MIRIILIIAYLAPLSTYAQEKNYSVTVNYVGNFIKAPLGFSTVLHLNNSDVGMYFDLKAGISNIPEEKDYTGLVANGKPENSLSDPYITSIESGILLFDIGLSYKLLTRFLIYGAVGYTKRDIYNKYYDTYRILSDDGNYYIIDKEKRGINVAGGLMYIFNNGITLQGGFDLVPFGANIGIGYTF